MRGEQMAEAAERATVEAPVPVAVVMSVGRCVSEVRVLAAVVAMVPVAHVGPLPVDGSGRAAITCV
ncbi:hypothetical protein Srubr_08300 [Streptomyces rubradiris]|uniref:Uncharacterized protein n=1 Tax=Streptomyces rubradiris TaxID=285531 RepID=A0ABQ3R575_STRRR|nr:hypothetical protein GCM10018792_67560 [Streptomyces rubradiris]GHI50984.1 hypothetical protein Srubr_08300 [Streptomyces rubradiris]